MDWLMMLAQQGDVSDLAEHLRARSSTDWWSIAGTCALLSSVVLIAIIGRRWWFWTESTYLSCCRVVAKAGLLLLIMAAFAALYRFQYAIEYWVTTDVNDPVGALHVFNHLRDAFLLFTAALLICLAGLCGLTSRASVSDQSNN